MGQVVRRRIFGEEDASLEDWVSYSVRATHEVEMLSDAAGVADLRPRATPAEMEMGWACCTYGRQTLDKAHSGLESHCHRHEKSWTTHDEMRK